MAAATTLTGADQLIWTGPGVLHGWSVRETAGAVASVRVRDGLSASGPVIAVLGFAANGYDTVGGLCLRFTTGLYFDVNAGAVEGAIWLE